MWLGNVELPQDLVEALHNDELVLFVGAGASMAAPSNLPSFKGLTSRICAECALPRRYPDSYPLDRILGELDDLDEVDVHARTAAHIGDPSSRPNALHHAIARLAAAMPTMRIVTTNYDRHLTTSLNDEGLAFNEYCGPALPVGDDFSGLVYLHGTLSHDPKELIVTDADFGRAYLSDAWAARFLERMFGRHKVLFIGYSHDDVIMTYLARGLGQVRDRYAMTDDGSRRAWKQLRIKPVVYSVVDDSHAELDQVLDRWARNSSMGLLDHRQQVRTLVEDQAPSGIPEQESYLSETIADPQRVTFFTTVARGGPWLEWVAKQEPFRRAIRDGDSGVSSGFALALWFAERYILDEAHSAEALQVLLEVAEGRIGPQLWAAIGSTMHGHDLASESWFGPWLSLMCRDDPGGDLNWLDYQLNRSDWPRSPESFLILFDHLTRPVIRLRSPFLGVSRPEVELQGDKYWLRRAWDEKVRPNLEAAVDGMVAIAEHNLASAMNVLVAAGGLRVESAYISRIAIEPHDQNWDHDDLDFLIDVLRDCMETMATCESPHLDSTLQRWVAMKHVLFIRLALHGWRVRTDITEDEKFDWLVSSKLFLDHRVRHEAYMLASQLISKVDESAVATLIAQVMEQPVEDESGNYAKFNALIWLRRYRPESALLDEAIANISAGQNWGEREDPDLVVSHSGGWRSPVPVISAGELHSELTTDVTAAIERLRDRVARLDFLGRDGISPTISSVVASYPKDGLSILAEFGDTEIVRAVLDGWTRVELDSETAAAVIVRLGSIDIVEHYRDVCDLLSGRVEGSQFDWSNVPGARELAATVWRSIPEDAEGGVLEGDVLTEAVNHPAGKIANFWSACVADDWRSAGENWQGLGAEGEALLNPVVCSGGLRGTLARATLVTRLHMFSEADSVWCARHLLPRLDWQSAPDARPVWEAYLHAGRWTPKLLTQGLFGGYFQTLEHVRELGDSGQQQLCEHFASIAVHGEGDFAPAGWIDRFVLGATREGRVYWADQIGIELSRLPSDVVENMWSTWLHSYWNRRVQGVPILLSEAEATSMLAWIVELSESVDDGIELGIASRAGLGKHSFLLHDLDRAQLSRSPTRFAALIQSLLKNTAPPSWAVHELGRVIADLRSLGIAEHEVTGLLEEAARFGFYED